MTRLADVRAAVLPLPDQVAQRLLPFADDAAVVLEREPAALGDVAEVRGNGSHASPSSRDLDHDLRGTPDDGRPDAVADDRCARAHAGSQAGLARSDDPVGWIEQALAPLDQDAVDARACHRTAPSELAFSAGPARPTAASGARSAISRDAYRRWARTSDDSASKVASTSAAKGSSPRRSRRTRPCRSVAIRAISSFDAVSAAKARRWSAPVRIAGAPAMSVLR